MLNQAAKKIIDGLLYGIGFSLPVCLGFYLAISHQSDSYFEDSDRLSSVENYGFSITESRIENIAEDMYVVGSILNSNEFTVTGVSIEAEFFNTEGAFVNKCTGSIGGKFKASEKRNFKLKCKPTNTEYSKYQINVTGAYTWEL